MPFFACIFYIIWHLVSLLQTDLFNVIILLLCWWFFFFIHFNTNFSTMTLVDWKKKKVFSTNFSLEYARQLFSIFQLKCSFQFVHPLFLVYNLMPLHIWNKWPHSTTMCTQCCFIQIQEFCCAFFIIFSFYCSIVLTWINYLLSQHTTLLL